METQLPLTMSVGLIYGSKLPADIAQSHQGHRHSFVKPKGHYHDLGIMGVLIHIVGDAVNNVGVIIAATIIWKAEHHSRFYADPGIGIAIAIVISLSAIPLGGSNLGYSLTTSDLFSVKNSGAILLESIPPGIKLKDVKHDLEKVTATVHRH